eukprot:CAMPEP_0203666252 /NCGR_PEP_ID=MMETSP0090-20130426/3312_1 /ASSEMBLY_ACC=CAM_ASM_001088 /TAXON_ID=426623 /ORGANISM="Chaetoceros affinis, Strain CCMP159" /LENGTH=866 /DNA_ID=CAMNT_0050530071 /DNA_START=21 /DNA_END=2621 /DNA_ORIENTATION=+
MNKRPSSPSSPALNSSNNIGECDVNERDTEKDSNDFKRAKTVPTATTSSSSDPNTPAAAAAATTATSTTTCTSSATASLSTATVMDDDDTINDDDEISKVIAQAWSHYRNYIEVCTTEDDDHDGDDDGEGNGDDNNSDNDVAKTADIDELYEIICLLGDSFNARAHAHAHAHANGSNSGETNDKGISIKALEKMSKDKDYNSLSSMISMSSSDAYRQGLVQQQSHTLALLESNSESSLRSLVPALLSMVHLHIANDLISQGFSSSLKPEPEPEPELMNNNSNNNGNDNHDTGTDTGTDPMIHLQKSLNYFPWNASSLSILANYKRMNLMDTQQNICTLYEIASVNASRVRELAISVLGEGEEEEEEQVIGGDGDNQEIQEEDDDKVQGNMHKEWVELLFLDGMTGVEYVGDDDDDDDGGCYEGQTTSGDDNENTIKDQDSNSNQNEKENVVNEAAINSEYSTSDVESVSSFMAALLHSTLRNHEMALFHLKKFNFTHRIHPNVWAYSMGDGGMKTATKEENQLIATTATASKDTATLAFEPKIFRGNVLPKDLYNGMCNVFAPKKPYWEESNYQNRGYYSFFNDLTDDILFCPSNLIEDVVINHLLPLIKAQIPSHEKIVGFEWWTHTRPLSANLGHQLHFDTDEALLDKEKKVTHPIISSVLYLTGNKDSGSQTAGSTIVFNQTPDSKEVASKAYVSHALNNSFMIFPGNCLHGVLPCPGSNEESNQGRSNNDGEERLTFMVGFWTRRVPDNIEEKKLYSPCGPLPPADDEHSWVKEIKKGYDGETKREDNAEKYGNKVIIPDVLPAVSPAWECIAENGKNNSDDDDKGHETENLPIPCSLDHRFFVHNAPQTFRESLFKDETFA